MPNAILSPKAERREEEYKKKRKTPFRFMPFQNIFITS